MYVFKGLGFTANAQSMATAQPMVNNPTVPMVGSAPLPIPMPVPVPAPGLLTVTVLPPGAVAPPGYVSIFGYMLSYTQLGLLAAALVGGFFLWKHYKTPAKTA